jgi:hypothetical protein
MTNKNIYITLLAVLGFSVEVFAQDEVQTNNAPKLVVNITIDQLRNDYLEAFIPLYSENGFKLMLNKGKVYSQVFYPFAPIDMSSAIASLVTGTTPYYNNITGQSWINRKNLRPVSSVEDQKCAGLLTNSKVSPAKLSTSTITDELKVGTAGKAVVYSIAPFCEAAILAGGHAANGAIWLDDQNGRWCSSNYYYSSLPSWIQSFNSLNAPYNTLKDKTWEPINELVGNFSYFMSAGLQKPFKHSFKGDYQYTDYKTSALINEDISNLAMQCILSTGMGKDKVTDMLCLTYYAGTFKHQSVTECQVELQDTYVRIDREIGRLVNFIDKNIGKENVLYVLTSTGYNKEEDVNYEDFRIPSGTFYMNRTANLLNMYLGGIWGQGNYVEASFNNHIYLNHSLLESKKISINEAATRAQEMLAMMSGVRNVYTSIQLLTNKNENIEKTRNAFSADHGGDLVIEVAPGWKVVNEDTQKSELSRASYIQFPIIFYSVSVQPERINKPVSATQLAPSIARAIRIRAPNACSVEPLH